MKFSFFNLNSLKNPKESKLFLSLLPTLQEKKTKQFTTLSLTFITIAFFGFFAIAPTFGTITDLQKQIDDSKFVNDALQKKIANLTTLQTSYATIQPQLSPVFAAVPTSPAIDSFVGQIHQLSLQTNVQLTRVQTFPLDLTAITVKTPYLSYAFSIEGQGDIGSLQNFMTQLAGFNRLITFDTIDYTRVGKIDATFRMTIRGKTYLKTAQ
ncbi:MAG TPA: type 4a pilus biogenesis protein PilO [Patescibacteria group bacterium]|nr:type 4a pilus biogenesis protein PilO [Patescibacteria group bacterium]